MTDHDHEHDHDHHDHHHGHAHDDGLDHSHDPSPESIALLKRLVDVLIAKGVVTEAALQQQEAVTSGASFRNGAHVVARAWMDDAFRTALLADGTKAVESLGYSMVGAPPLGIVANTPDTHYLIVCTLCSCYPRMLLGYPPHWYKSTAYRARAVRDPRGVLKDFGLTLPDATEVRVVDSTADYRWMVLPMRPAGTEDFTEAQLMDLITRDCLVGAGIVPEPALAV